MSSMLAALCWKEYRELRWNVLAMVAIGIAPPLYAFVREREAAYFWATLMLAIYSVIGGICLGMWCAAGERANRSASFVDALPVSPPLVGGIKLLIMIVAAFIPILAISLVAIALEPFAEVHSDPEPSVWALTGIYFAIAVHIALVTATFGLGQRTELLAAGVGILVLAIWGVCSIGTAMISRLVHWEGAGILVFFGPPVYLLFSPVEPPPHIWSPLAGMPLTAIAMLGLAGTFVVRYSAAIRPVQSRQSQRAGTWISSQYASPVASLVLKQLCETTPLVLLVLGSAILLSVGFGTVGHILNPSNTTYPNNMSWLVDVGGLFVIFIFLSGFLLSLLLGVVAFAGDLEPKVSTFWRSRPISPTLWFWSKYLIALSSFVLAIGLPAVICFVLIEFFQRGAGLPGEAFFVAIGWFGIFSAAVVSTCIVRRPLHSGLLAFGLAAAGLGLAQWLDPGWFGAEPLKHPLLIASIWLLASIAATLTAWWAAVRDVAAFQ